MNIIQKPCRTANGSIALSPSLMCFKVVYLFHRLSQLRMCANTTPTATWQNIVKWVRVEKWQNTFFFLYIFSFSWCQLEHTSSTYESACFKQFSLLHCSATLFIFNFSLFGLSTNQSGTFSLLFRLFEKLTTIERVPQISILITQCLKRAHASIEKINKKTKERERKKERKIQEKDFFFSLLIDLTFTPHII